MEQIGQLPEAGDSFKYENLTITVTETDGRRVAFVEVFREEPEEDEDSDSKKESKSSKETKDSKKDSSQKSDK